jgi:hypothetical protein
MSDAQHDHTNAPFSTLLTAPISARPGQYPPMPKRPSIRSMIEFAHAMEGEDPFNRGTFCGMARHMALERRHYQLEQERQLRRQAATMPNWILNEEMIPQQVPPGVAVGWFTIQFLAGEDSLLQLARTVFADGTSVETVFTGHPERMWETSTLLDGDLTVSRSHTLEEANRTHTGNVARLIAHYREEPTMERRKRVMANA